MLLGKCCPHGARCAAEPQTRSCRAPCANTRARKRKQARAHSPAGKRGGGGGIGKGRDKGHVAGLMLAARRTRRGRAAKTRAPRTLRQHTSAQTNAGASPRVHARARLALRMPVRRTLFFSLFLFTAFPLFPPLSISRGAAARAQCAAAVLCTMLMLDDTRASVWRARAHQK